MIYEECKVCRWFEGCCYNPDRTCVNDQYSRIKDVEGLEPKFYFGGYEGVD